MSQSKGLGGAGELARQTATTALSGGNSTYVEDLYERYLAGEAVPPDWQQYFATLGATRNETAHGPLVRQIAERARLSKQTMTTLVRLCERDGLVVRERDPHDARAFRIKLTKRAKEFRPVAGQILRELDGKVLAALGERQTATLARALKGVMDL